MRVIEQGDGTMDNSCKKVLSELLDVYFLECSYERPQRRVSEAKVFYVGPYLTIHDAARRTKTLPTSLPSLVEAMHIRSLKAEVLENDRYLVEGTRVFNRSSLISVSRDGEPSNGIREFHLPSDFFDTGIELV